MAVVRSIRITMPDRPGALSAVTTALAAHRVDIVRLDVVSHEGEYVVDDLLLEAATAEDIGAAIGGFWPEVSVRTFDAPVADPAVEMGRAIAAATGAPTRVDAAARAVSGIIRVMRADRAAVLRCIDTGGFVPVAGLPATAVIGPREPFAGRWVLEQRTAAAFPAAEGWAPAAFAAETRAAWVALAPLGGTELAAAFRCTNVPFYRGELERLESLAMAVAPALGAGPAARPLGAGAPGSLPARAITLGAA